MIKEALFATALVSVASTSNADQLTFTDSTGKPLEFARVNIGGHPFITDRYGTIDVPLPAGQHSVEVILPGQSYSSKIDINGGPRSSQTIPVHPIAPPQPPPHHKP
jgi:hypothetical protein